MNSVLNTVTVTDFSESFGANESTFSASCRELISQRNFNFRYIEGAELEALTLTILKKIDEDRQVIASLERQAVWEKGWKENFDEFIASNFDESKLIPKFIRSNVPVRFKKRYIFPEDPDFELNFVKVFRHWFLDNYFSNVDNIYEFGCGTGFNLLAASEIFSDKTFYGSDFVQSSVLLVNAIGDAKQIPLTAEIFDMLKPNDNYEIKKNSGVFTFGSLEQLASKTDNMLEYLIAQRPNIIVHTEPAIELYDENNLTDFLAMKFQGKRGYTEGFLPKLQCLHREGKIELIKVKRLHFGSLFMEGYNLIVWKPI